MRKLLVALFCMLVASSAFAGTITSLNPASFQVNSGEHFITVYGTAPGNVLVFDGPAGHFERAVSATFATNVVGWVPEAVIAKSGTHSLKVRSANGAETNTLTFTVNGFKFFPLAIFVPDILFEQARSRDGAFVRYEVFAAGGEDPNPTYKCDQESGAFYKMGVTRVNCTASNSFDERADASFDITVADRLGPVVTVPKDIKVAARTNEGAIVEWADVKAVDEVYGDMPFDCTPKSGSMFRIGKHAVICTSVDLESNMGSGSFVVEVTSDRQLPTLTLLMPDQTTVVAKDPSGAKVVYDVRVKGTKDPNVVINCAPKSGSLFPLGLTTVACEALDVDGAWAKGSFDILVVDDVAPQIRSVKASPDRIGEDGRLWPVEITVDAVDDLDLRPTCTIIGVNANEAIYGGDDEEKPEYDFVLKGPLSLELRGQSTRVTRVYNVWVGCTDFFGNMGQGLAQVLVSKDPAGQSSSTGRRRAGAKP
jgi:hypothetical protein